MTPTRLEQILDALLHPRLIMAAVSLLVLYAGVVTAVYENTYVHMPLVWAVLGVVAGLCGLAAVVHPTRWTVSVSGAVLVVVALSRGVALAESVVFIEQPSEAVAASQAVGAVTWLTLGYVTWALWRRQVVPWSVVRSVQRSRADDDV
jgi:hypothetical protein